MGGYIYNTSKDKAYLAYGIAVRTQSMLDARNRRTFEVSSQAEGTGIQQSNIAERIVVSDEAGVIASSGFVAGTSGRVPLIAQTGSTHTMLGINFDIFA